MAYSRCPALRSVLSDGCYSEWCSVLGELSGAVLVGAEHMVPHLAQVLQQLAGSCELETDAAGERRRDAGSTTWLELEL